MNCYDCAFNGNRHLAVATCVDCGAGLCLDHAVVFPHHLTRVELLDLRVNVEPPARLIYCETCAAAHDAVVGHAAGPYEGFLSTAPMMYASRARTAGR